MADTSAGTSQDWQIKNGRWQWRDDSGNWNDYGDASNAKSRVVNVRDGQQTQYYNPMMGNWVYSPEKLTPTNTPAPQQQAQQQQSSASGSSGTTGSSYLNSGQSSNTSSGNTSSNNMADNGLNFNSWDEIAQHYGFQQSDINAFINNGWNPASFSQAAQRGYGLNQMLTNADQVQSQLMGRMPETTALQQMAKIDPTSEALRNSLAASYLNQSQNPPQLAVPGAPTNQAPTAAALQSYLDTYKGVDPTGLAGRQQLEQALTQQSALGSKLDPETAREIEQQTRLAQTARGNVYGTPQLVEEAMTRGQAGEARQRQRQQDLQSFLQSGQDVGSVAHNLYTQGQQDYLNKYNQYLNAWNTQQANQRANQQGALSYLTSGATPYAVGANYYDRATGASSAATAGGPSYNTGGGVSGTSGTSGSSAQGYGTQTAQSADQLYQQMLQQYSMTPIQKNRTGAALGGAVSGAVAGVPLAASTYGLSVVGGALAGGLGGYFS